MTSIFVRPRRALATAAVLAVTAVAIAACSTGPAPETSPTAAGDCETKVLVVANVTGAGSSNGAAVQASSLATEDIINEAGGVLGCKLVVDVKDDGSDYTKALPIVQEGLAATDYAMVTSADFGAGSVLPYVGRQGVFGIFSNGTKGLFDPKIYPYVFDTSVPSADTAKALAAYAVQNGAKKIAVAIDTTTVGQSVLDAITAVANAQGAEVVGSEKIDLSSVNMTPAVQRLQATGADTVIVNLFGQAGGFFFRDLNASGWKVTKYGTNSVLATNIAALVPIADLKGVILAGTATATAPSVTDGLENLKTALLKAGPIPGVMGSYAQVHDALIMFAWAANEGGSLKAADLTAYLEKNGDKKVPGLAGADTTNYSSTNHEWHPKDGIAIVPIGEVKDGQYTSKRIDLIDG